MDKIVKYRDWIFEVDFDITKEVYDNVKIGSPESCGCDYCKNFSKNRDQIYPQEFKELLACLGIDFRKESEIYQMYRAKNGKHFYGGWFHFKGRIKKGKDCKIESPNGGVSLDTTFLTENFQIGFLKDNSLSFFNSEKDLIQVEFYVFCDWVIDKSLEFL